MDNDDQKLTDDTNDMHDQIFEGEQPLANDFDTPAAPPDDDFPIDHPTTDTDMDAQEVYDAGRRTAALGAESENSDDDMLKGMDMSDIE